MCECHQLLDHNAGHHACSTCRFKSLPRQRVLRRCGEVRMTGAQHLQADADGSSVGVDHVAQEHFARDTVLTHYFWIGWSQPLTIGQRPLIELTRLRNRVAGPGTCWTLCGAARADDYEYSQRRKRRSEKRHPRDSPECVHGMVGFSGSRGKEQRSHASCDPPALVGSWRLTSITERFTCGYCDTSRAASASQSVAAPIQIFSSRTAGDRSRPRRKYRTSPGDPGA